MKNTKVAKCISLAFLTLTLLLTVIPVHAAEPEPTGSRTISTFVSIKKWKYKVENGHLYRRLFNYTTGEWIGDWELVP